MSDITVKTSPVSMPNISYGKPSAADVGAPTGQAEGAKQPSAPLLSGEIRLNNPVTAQVGENVFVTIVKNEGSGNFIFEIFGQHFAGVSKELLPDIFSAKIVDGNILQLQSMDAANKNDIAQSILQILKKGVNENLHILSSRPEALTQDEIKSLIKDSGLFFENKIAHDQSITTDAKYNSITQEQPLKWDAITLMQMAAVMINDGVFSSFNYDAMEGDGVINIKKGMLGVNINIKMSFTNIGDTVINISPSTTGVYNVMVKTALDISSDLSKVELKGANIRWAKIKQSDTQPFDIKDRLIGKLGRFDITA